MMRREAVGEPSSSSPSSRDADTREARRYRKFRQLSLINKYPVNRIELRAFGRGHERASGGTNLMPAAGNLGEGGLESADSTCTVKHALYWYSGETRRFDWHFHYRPSNCPPFR